MKGIFITDPEVLPPPLTLSLYHLTSEGGFRESAGDMRVYFESEDKHFFRTKGTGNLLEKAFGICLRISEDHSAHSTFARARAWLARCVDSHDACDAPGFKPPRRVLRLGAKTGTTTANIPDTIFLEETTPEDTCQYACLSYRWGVPLSEAVCTTVDNIEAHMTDGIPVATLSKTLQDAVKVCHRLEISLLWVDALCIIQNRYRDGQTRDEDAEKDFRDEGGRMHDIFGRSYLTIYADCAIDSNAGFLGKPSFSQESYQRHVGLASNGQPYCVRWYYGDRPYQRSGPWPPELTEFDRPRHLESRGWCLQETLLANRQLHFFGTEMVWECNAANLCECGHVLDSAPHWPLSKDIREAFVQGKATLHGISCQSPLVLFKPIGKAVIPDAGPAESWHPKYDLERIWETVIKDYTRRQLTVGSDKLIAVSAVASLLLAEYKRRGDDQQEYLAGLWKTGLPWGFNWQVADFAESERTDSSLPSWSWASVTGALRRVGSSSRSTWENWVKSIHVVPLAAENQTGQIAAGSYLELQGLLAPAVLGILPREFELPDRPFWYSQTNAFIAGHRWHHAVDLDLNIPDNVAENHYECWSRKNDPIKPPCLQRGCGEGGYSMLAFGERDTNGFGTERCSHYFGLLLRSKGRSGDTKVYERIGVGSFFGSEHDDGSFFDMTAPGWREELVRVV